MEMHLLAIYDGKNESSDRISFGKMGGYFFGAGLVLT